MNNETGNIADAISTIMHQIDEYSAVAQRLKTAYVNDMQKDAGYRITTTDEKIIAKFNAGEFMPKGLARLAELGLVEKIEVEPSDELISAVDALDSQIKNLGELVQQFITMRQVTVKTGKKRSGTRSTGAAGAGKLNEVLSIDPSAKISLVDVGMSHPHIVGTLSNGKRIDIDCYAATLENHVNTLLKGKA